MYLDGGTAVKQEQPDPVPVTKDPLSSGRCNFLKIGRYVVEHHFRVSRLSYICGIVLFGAL
jgi:hypothetical protein